MSSYIIYVKVGWLAVGYCYVGALGSCLFNNVSFLSYFLTLTPSVNGFAELPVQQSIMSIGCLIFGWPPPMPNPGYATAMPMHFREDIREW